MNGKRIYPQGKQHDLIFEISETPASYGSVNGKDWFACTPNGLLGNLSAHNVIENQDGTITVTPSILVNRGKGETWHGFLTNGMWREC